MGKPSKAATDAFAAFPDDPRAERKKMFGMACGVVNGNMFGGVFEKGVTLRLPEDRRPRGRRGRRAPVVPTLGTGGIGRATALRCVEEDAKVFVTDASGVVMGVATEIGAVGPATDEVMMTTPPPVESK